MIEDKSFTFRLPVTLMDQVNAIAKLQDLSAAQLLRRVLREMVEKNNG